MADVLVADVARFDVLLAATNQLVAAQNSFYLRNTAAPWSAFQLNAVLDDVETAWTTHIAPVCHSLWTYVGTRARDIGTSPYGPTVERFASASVPGTLGGDAVPYFAAAVVQLIGDPTADPDEPRRSYIRHSGLAESQVTGNAVVPASVTAIAAAYGSFLDALSDPVPTSANVIVSLNADGVPGGPGASNTLDVVLCRTALGRASSRAGIRP